MSETLDRKPLFERLRTGLEEGIRFARGEIDLRMAVIPAPPPDLRARDVVQLRQRLNVTQSEFARILNVSAKTVQSWEQGQRRPAQAALRLLQILGERPEVLREIIATS